jgi:hypothetical protein
MVTNRKLFSDQLSSILHGALVGVGSQWPHSSSQHPPPICLRCDLVLYLVLYERVWDVGFL